MHYMNKFAIVLLLSVFLFSFVPSVSAPTNATNITNITGVECTDSDEGVNYYVKGTVDTNPGSLGGEATDYCDGATGQLIEYYCTADGSNGGASSVFYTCPNGCVDGACQGISTGKFRIADVSGKLVVSPGESVKYTIKGVEPDGTSGNSAEGFNAQWGLQSITNDKTYGGGNAYYSGDYWYADVQAPPLEGQYNLIFYFYCSLDNSLCAQKYGIAAQVEKWMLLSVQGPTSSCTDSDGGLNYNVRGTVTDSNGKTYTDFCGDGYLAEHYCGSDGNVWNYGYTCPNGCRDGACNPVNATYVCGNGVCEAGETQQSCPQDCGDGIKIYTPSEGEILKSGSAYTILWDAPVSISNVWINALQWTEPCPAGSSCSQGVNSISIAENAPNTGSYTWKVPADYRSKYWYIMIQGKNSSIFGRSGKFSIASTNACGNGVCEVGESQQSCPQDCATTCTASVTLDFNKDTYYPGDFFEVTVKLYDQSGNLIPNRMFYIYSDRYNSTSTYYTDSNGIYKSTSTIPSDQPSYNGAWTFTAYTSDNCPSTYSKKTIYLNIPVKCGDGYCDENEKQLECSTVCPSCPTLPQPPATGSSFTGGVVSATASQPASSLSSATQCGKCNLYCHARCVKDCTPNCGNGVCDTSMSCTGTGCPLPENEENCPQDCKQANYCGSQSSDPNCICQEGYIREAFEASCQTTVSQTASGGGSGGSATGYVTASSSSGQITCTDSDGGKNYYVKGVARGIYGGVQGFSEDYCHDFSTEGFDLTEFYCINDTYYGATGYICPGGCSDGACIISSNNETAKEQVKCVFKNSNSAQKCYSDSGYGCSGTETCVADVSGSKGTGMTWKSSCGGYATTVIDGQNDYAYFDCGTSSTCKYYRCVPSYVNLYLTTDKPLYNIGEQVQIFTSSFMNNPLNITTLQVTVKDPYGLAQNVDLKQTCQGEGTCPACVTGEYCPPCKSYTSCKFQGIFAGTKSVGTYEVSPLNAGSGIQIYTAYFKVYDNSVLEKYLILKDIDGFTYKNSQPQHVSGNTTGYMANYEKGGRGYMAVVIDFGSRDILQNYLSEAFRYNSPSEEKIDGNYIYVVNSGGQKVYAWTYNTFLVGVAEQAVYATKQETTAVVPQAQSESAAATKEKQNSQDFISGQITGMPIAKTPETQNEAVNCGSDSLYKQCACKGDETKESFQPPCASGSTCETHYRCKQQVPTELLKAYLGRYPSDIHATGTECQQKNGYCISSQDACADGFRQTTFACKTGTEKCCVKQVDKSDFLDIVMKLEGIRVRMDSLQRQSSSLADYYTSTGDTERAKKFTDVTEMFKTAKGMIDNIITKIRENLDNPDSVRDEIKKDVNTLKDYIDSILTRMVS